MWFGGCGMWFVGVTCGLVGVACDLDKIVLVSECKLCTPVLEIYKY